MTLLEVVMAVVLGLVANEIFEITPWLARHLVQKGAMFAYPGERGQDRAEEWEAFIYDRPGKLAKLMTAVGLVGYAIKVGVVRRTAVPLAEVGLVAQQLRAGKWGTQVDAATVSLTGCAWLIGDKDTDTPTSIHLLYSAEDPYAVTVTFTDDDGEPVTWTFGRDLLAEGMVAREQPITGAGDVAFFGTSNTSGYLWMGLSSPDGEALFALRRRTVRRFLRHSYRLVPPGTEPARLDLVGAIGRLLA